MAAVQAASAALGTLVGACRHRAGQHRAGRRRVRIRRPERRLVAGRHPVVAGLLRHVYRITAVSRGRSPVDDAEPAGGSGGAANLASPEGTGSPSSPGSVAGSDLPDAEAAVAGGVYCLRAPAPLRQAFGPVPSLADSGPGPGGAGVDPATLLTAEEVSAAFGRPFGPPRSLTPEHALPFLGVRMCEYDAAGPDRARVQVQTVTGRIARAMLERVRGEPLPGVGEAAFVRGDAVAVLQGDVGLAIHAQHVDAQHIDAQHVDAQHIDGAATRAALCQLAATAAARLPAQPSRRS
jgi:hypothetical protein